VCVLSSAILEEDLQQEKRKKRKKENGKWRREEPFYHYLYDFAFIRIPNGAAVVDAAVALRHGFNYRRVHFFG